MGNGNKASGKSGPYVGLLMSLMKHSPNGWLMSCKSARTSVQGKMIYICCMLRVLRTALSFVSIDFLELHTNACWGIYAICPTQRPRYDDSDCTVCLLQISAVNT